MDNYDKIMLNNGTIIDVYYWKQGDGYLRGKIYINDKPLDSSCFIESLDEKYEKIVIYGELKAGAERLFESHEGQSEIR